MGVLPHFVRAPCENSVCSGGRGSGALCHYPRRGVIGEYRFPLVVVREAFSSKLGSSRIASRVLAFGVLFRLLSFIDGGGAAVKSGDFFMERRACFWSVSSIVVSCGSTTHVRLLGGKLCISYALFVFFFSSFLFDRLCKSVFSTPNIDRPYGFVYKVRRKSASQNHAPRNNKFMYCISNCLYKKEKSLLDVWMEL